MGKLSERVIVVAGGAGFLGLQFVEAIDNAGGTPIIIDRHDVDKYKTYVGDLTSEDFVKSVLDDIIIKYGRIDGVVYSACNNPKIENPRDYFGRLETFDIDKVRQDIDIGLVGAFICAKHFGTYMEKCGKGVFINIGSELGIVGPNQSIYEYNSPKPISYTITKSGLIGLTKYLSTYWKNVRCNIVAFGGMYNNHPKSFVDKLSKLIPLNRMAKYNEYNNTIIYLLSDDSSYMTGSVMVVDGGRTAW